ncbi:hypothetical protein Daus18300_011790 [Diaporthe australafricana]|uniref:DUF6594 domain-containing protein n=1 Tax=Diaporthe australafricana TaxID=127596 RepID=A0ABR3W584_9PEZI
MLESLRIKLEQYDNLLSQYIQLRSRPAAPRLNVNNVRTWLSNEDNPIAEEEVEFIGENDLITLAAFEKPLARRVFEQRLLSPTLGLWGLFSSTRGRKHRDDERPTTVQGDDGPVNFVASVAVFLTVLVMLIAPLWALAYMESLESKLSTITGFTLLLLVFFSSGTAARPFEMLAATAGYVVTFDTS